MPQLLNNVNSECIGTAICFATHTTDAILHIGWDVVNQFGKGLAGWCFEHGGAILQQIVIDGGLQNPRIFLMHFIGIFANGLVITLLAHINLV